MGQGLRPFVLYPPSCRGGRFYTTEQFMGVFVSLVLCCHFLGHDSDKHFFTEGLCLNVSNNVYVSDDVEVVLA